MDPEKYEAIRIEHREDGVVLATMDWPELLNPPIGRMHTELSLLAPDFDYDQHSRVLVLTGSGRAFAAGRRDIVMGARAQKLGLQHSSVEALENAGGSHDADMWYEARRIVDGILECRKPIIAAVNGYAFGLGANIALLCDVVVAARSAVFADTHVRTGVGAGDGGQVIWPLLMGVNRAKYYLMTGDRLTADEAERFGLVNFVVEDDQLLDRALEIAHRLGRGPLEAIIASKVPISQWMRAQSAQILPLSMAMQHLSSLVPNAREGLTAFAEGRDPEYGS